MPLKCDDLNGQGLRLNMMESPRSKGILEIVRKSLNNTVFSKM